MSNLSRFSADLDRAFEDKVEGNVIAFQKKIALEALRRLIFRTPVLSGRARGNWQVSLGVRDDGVLEVTDPSGQPTIDKGTRPIMDLNKFDIIYIQNNLPYIKRLDDGYSKQAPAGIVAVTVAEIEAFMGQFSSQS
jgi:Tfp pilus assembly protein FimT